MRHNWSGQARPKRNFCFEVNGRFGTTCSVTLYLASYMTSAVGHIFCGSDVIYEVHGLL